MNDSKVTYEKIATISGLSLSTISRVFNKSPYVTEKTRNKVIAAMREIGLDTSALDLLPVATNNLIIFNVPTLKNPFYLPIATSARVTANRHGYSLLVNEDAINEDTYDSFIRLIKTTHAVGLVVTNNLSKEILARLSSVLPVVACCEADFSSAVPYVTIDDELAAVNATQHLISLGKKRIAMLNGPAAFKYARDRYKGYEYAIKRAGFEIKKDLIAEISEDMDFDMAKAAAMHMLNSKERPDAFFCISDVLATAAIKATVDLGYRVPDEVAVVGFDDISISAMMNPSITTVRQPTAQMGSLATEMLIKLINDSNAPVNSLCLGTELIIRESTMVGKKK